MGLPSWRSFQPGQQLVPLSFLELPTKMVLGFEFTTILPKVAFTTLPQFTQPFQEFDLSTKCYSRLFELILSHYPLSYNMQMCRSHHSHYHSLIRRS